MCGVRRIRVEHAFWTAYVADVTAIGDTNDTLLGLVTTCRDFMLFEWDLKPYHRKISLYKRIFFVLRVPQRVVVSWRGAGVEGSDGGRRGARRRRELLTRVALGHRRRGCARTMARLAHVAKPTIRPRA